MMERAWIWLTGEKHSLYGLAVTRILLGLIVWTQLAANFADRHYTWGDGAEWTQPVRDAKGWPDFFNLMFANASGRVFDIVYIATIFAGIAMMVGIASRAATFLTLFLWMSLYVANPFVGSGGDAVLRMVLLYMCFVDAGRHWSVDDWLRRRKGETAPRLPEWFTATLHNVALILIIHQVVMVYVASALWKVQSDVWMGGTAVYYPLHVEAYSPWIKHIDLLTDHGWIIAAATYTAIGVQLFVPVLLMYRPTRFLALLALTGMHLGIGLLMGILFFSLVMIAVDVLLISDRSWARAEAVVAGLWARMRDKRSRNTRNESLL